MSSIFLRARLQLIFAGAGVVAELIAIAVYFLNPTPVTLMIAWAGLIIGIGVLLAVVIASQLAKRQQ